MLRRKRIAWPTVVRLSEYLIILEELVENGVDVVTSRELAGLYGNNANQVRQDLFCLAETGRVGQGYSVPVLERTIRQALGLTEPRGVAIVGCGRLGTVLALHVPLANYGLNLVAAFDVDPNIVGKNLGAVRIDHADRMTEICRDRRVRVAALSVPEEAAQDSASKLVAAGVVGILNYTRVRLKVPARVVVQNRQIICSFIQIACAAFCGHDSLPSPGLVPDADVGR
ncbi:MAG: redox-sensing transcriptional repressor Rex [Kiritimatiellaeota bacterium]|nr:redox-sensing transcriptional repressor Rex [Kiritimatiellota bacterium]